MQGEGGETGHDEVFRGMFYFIRACFTSRRYPKHVILLTMSFSMLNPCVKEVEISCLGFLSFQYLAVVSASFQSPCLHGKLCDTVTTVCVVVLKGFYCCSAVVCFI